MEFFSLLSVWFFYHPIAGGAIFIALACGVFYALDKAEVLV